jgi:hypothetical protein
MPALQGTIDVTLLLPQGDDRIDLQGAPRRHVAGRQGHGREQNRYRREAKGIERAARRPRSPAGAQRSTHTADLEGPGTALAAAQIQTCCISGNAKLRSMTPTIVKPVLFRKMRTA